MRYVFLLLLASCATQPPKQFQWVKISGGGTQEEFLMAQGACEAQALQSHPGISVERGVQIYGACMRSKGWVLVER